MITANDVFSTLCSNYDTSGYPQTDLLDCCKTALSWVRERLKKGVPDTHPLVAETAAAIAHFNFFVRTLSEPEKYESYRVGDITVNCDPSKALEREILLRDRAVADASSILTDGGFYCCGY